MGAMQWICRGVLSGIAVVIIAGGFTSVASALNVPPAPPLDRPIVDQTATLTSEQIDGLAKQISQSRSQKDYQLGVLMISSLEGQRDIEGYALSVARQWGIGAADKDNGVLLLIVKDDRRMRIEVGNGLEGDLTDAESGRIINGAIAPEFRNGDYYKGIQAGVENIQAEVEGRTPQYSANSRKASDKEGLQAIVFMGIWFILTVGSWIAAVLGRSKSWWAGGVIGGALGLSLIHI